MSAVDLQCRVVQLAPAALQGWPGSGYWKDFEGRRILLEEFGLPLTFGWYDSDDLASAVSQVDDATTDVIIEYSTCPVVVEAIRQARPRARIHVRAHNAEALQHWHRVQPSLWPSRKNLKNWYGVARLAAQDRRSAVLADTVLSISHWDAVHYWNRLVPRGRCRCLPYFSPWPTLRPETKPLPWFARDNQIVCMPGGLDRLTRQQTELFGCLAEALQASAAGSAPRCVMTNYADEPRPDAAAITSLGKIGDPWELLCRSKGVAVLTDLGFGAKTTLFDGLAAGCRLFVHRGLISRLPLAIQPHCTPIDPTDWTAASEIVGRQLAYAPDGTSHVHDLIHSEARETMRTVLRFEPLRRDEPGQVASPPIRHRVDEAVQEVT